MALSIPPKVLSPEATRAAATMPATDTVATRAPTAATLGGPDAGRAHATRLTPARSSPLDAALKPPTSANDVETIVVTGKPEARWYSGWDQNHDKAWVKQAVTPAELERIETYGMTRTQYNALLTSLYRPQSEQNLAARFNKSEQPHWPMIQAVMTPTERQQASSGQMTPADATRILFRAHPEYAWAGTPAPTFTPVEWFAARTQDAE